MTPADAARMEELATAQDHRRLTANERREQRALVDRWEAGFSRAVREQALGEFAADAYVIGYQAGVREERARLRAAIHEHGFSMALLDDPK